MKIYLDACCLSRPFDDQSQQKIYLESQAILFILSKCRHRELELRGKIIGVNVVHPVEWLMFQGGLQA